MTNYECNGLNYKTNSTKSVKHCPGCGSTDFVMDDCRCANHKEATNEIW